MTLPPFDDFRELLLAETNEQIVRRAMEQTDFDVGVPDARTMSIIYPMMISLLESYHQWLSSFQVQDRSDSVD